MRKSNLKYLTLISQIGLTIVISIILSTIIGYYLDQWLGTRIIFTLIFIVIGCGSGMWTAYQLVVKISLDDLDK